MASSSFFPPRHKPLSRYLIKVKAIVSQAAEVCHLLKSNLTMRFSTASTPCIQPARRPLLPVLMVALALFWALSFAGTIDLSNWWVENLVTGVFLAVLAATYRRFAFSDLSYVCFTLFLMLHVYGAKYAYADNPFGFFIQRTFHTMRNPYDRVVHFLFGALMAYPVRELLMRRAVISRRWSWLLPVEILLSASCVWELIEWGIADVFFPEQGISYVGTQGDVWDAQKDIFVAVCGAALSMLAGYLLKRRMGHPAQRQDAAAAPARA